LLRVDSLRQRNDLGENLEFLRPGGPAAEQHIHNLFEIEKPERKLQIARVENQRTLSETAAVLVVNVEQENSQIRPRLENLVQQQRDAGRFADAGRAKYREMLGEQLLDIDIGDDRGVLLQGADVDLIRSNRCIDRAKVLMGDHVDVVTDGRIVGDAALKFRPLRSTEDFAEQVDRGGGDIDVRGRNIFAGHLRDHGDDGGGCCTADADKPADRSPDVRLGHLARRQQPEPGDGAAH
jgi:hypothetical protein